MDSMKKKRRCFILAVLVCLLTRPAVSVLAEPIKGEEQWCVEFTADKKMESNFTTANFDDVIDYMQPGDSAIFQIEVKNTYETETNWYMTNEVLKSLEDTSQTAAGGAYSYILTYTNAKGEVKTLYNSEEVGGENYREDKQGLHEATDALEDFFYLDTVEHGKSGMVSLYVLLDGETQGNDYQDTLAQLQMNFAVEIPTITKGEKSVQHEKVEYRENHIVKTGQNSYTNTWKLVKTGDETNLTFLYVLALILGILFLVVSIISIRIKRSTKERRR